MARNQTIVEVKGDGQWTELSNGDVTNISFQVLEGSIKVVAGVSSTSPDKDAPGWVYKASFGELNLDITKLSNDALNNRLYAFSFSDLSKVLVDHA